MFLRAKKPVRNFLMLLINLRPSRHWVLQAGHKATFLRLYLSPLKVPCLDHGPKGCGGNGHWMVLSSLERPTLENLFQTLCISVIIILLSAYQYVHRGGSDAVKVMLLKTGQSSTCLDEMLRLPEFSLFMLFSSFSH